MEEKLYDLTFLKHYFDGDMVAVLPILEMYVDGTPKEISNLESCLRKNETAAAKAVTHKIKTNVYMLSLQDETTFINDMHLLKPEDNISEHILEEFEKFKSAVISAIDEIRLDFFPDKKAELS